MTHRELPWVRARRRAGVAEMQRSDEQLTDEEMFELFDYLVAASSDGES
jgi:hypothetical protein